MVVTKCHSDFWGVAVLINGRSEKVSVVLSPPTDRKRAFCESLGAPLGKDLQHRAPDKLLAISLPCTPGSGPHLKERHECVNNLLDEYKD
jgi:hypothetical protein